MCPEPGGEPGVQHVLILVPSLARRLDLDTDTFLRSLGGIPDGDAVAPPKLAGNAPVLDVAEPVVVDLFPAVGKEADQPILDRGTGLGGLRILQEPLLAEAWLDRDVGPLAEAHIVLIRLFLGQQSEFPKALDGLHPRLEPIESREALTGQFIEPAVGIHDVDHRQVVPQADLVVSLVMGRGDLQDACAKLKVDGLVPKDRQEELALKGEGPPDVLADQMGIAFVLRVHGDGRVPHDRLRTGGGDFKPGARGLHDLELEVIKVALLLLGNDLLVAQRGERDGAPVHHPLATVDEALAVQVDEDLLHLAGIVLVHGEALPAPVAGGAEFLELADDDSAVLLLPFPDLGEEGLPAKVVTGLFLLLAELALDDGLGGDARVIGTGKPEDFVPRLAGTAGEDVLQGIVEDMAEGEDPRHVRGGDDDRIGGCCGRGIGGEASRVTPAGVPGGLDLTGKIGFGEFGHGKGS